MAHDDGSLPTALSSAQAARLAEKAQSGAAFTLEDLLALMAVLRDPDCGCPWDVQQNFETIAPFTIEEAYEVADAIRRDDMPDLKEELGDLLLQVVYHAQMAREGGQFAFADVVDSVTRKMIRRHPHVFGDEETRNSIEMRGLWDRIKAEEAELKRQEKGEAAREAESVLDGVAIGLPALMRAAKLQSRAAKIGFDWPDAIQIIGKLHEEIGELKDEIPGGNQSRIEDEFGDILFVISNLGRRLNVDPEAALARAITKFSRRFRYVEQRLKENDRAVGEASLQELNGFWDEAKALEKQAPGGGALSSSGE